MSKDIYWLNKDSRTFLERGYLLPGVTPEARIREIAEYAEKLLDLSGYANKLEDYIRRGWFSLASPIWSNFGAGRGLPISCNGSYIPDTTEGILEKASEVGIMTKHGAGTSAFFGAIRGRGAPIRSGGKSSGVVSFLGLYESVTNTISQSNVRRGSFAAYLPVEHPDILEFLQVREEGNAIQHISIGVTIGDVWMKAMVDGDKDKRKIWGAIIKKRFESGYPYIMFSDTVNRGAPQVYRDKGMTIHASNLCVAPETTLMTLQGSYPISSLEGKEVEVWNGKQWSKTTVVKTGVDQPVIKVTFEDGRSLDCTPYHRFYVDLNDWIMGSDCNKPSTIVEVRAADLKPGQLVHSVSRGSSGLNLSGSSGGGAPRASLLKVESVHDWDRTCDTYCVNEPLEHKAVFNGILTGNCSEIALASSPDESFVCDLSSLNLLHYDDWKGTDAVEVLTYLLDAAMTDYINKTQGLRFMEAAHRFAVNQRALGLGVLGWHSYLQSKLIPFESMEAKFINTQAHKLIRDKSQAASRVMAARYGEPALLKGYGMRNVTTMAIAPTTSSSFILGQVSPSIEPLHSNYFVKDLAKGKFTYRNPHLKAALAVHHKDDKATWESILLAGGSVQHLAFLSDNERDVFKTFAEISQKEIVIQASARQKYIDQSQSLNLMIHAKTPPKDVSQLLIDAWLLGCKTLYYQRGSNLAQELGRSILACKSCEA